MLCALSVRRLKPGAYDDFRAAWEPDEFPRSFQRAYHVRDVRDSDLVVSFGLLDIDAAELGRLREEIDETEEHRQEAMAPYVDELIVDGIFEVVEEVVPAAR
jgi:hypothetical protein